MIATVAFPLSLCLQVKVRVRVWMRKYANVLLCVLSVCVHSVFMLSVASTHRLQSLEVVHMLVGPKTIAGCSVVVAAPRCIQADQKKEKNCATQHRN